MPSLPDLIDASLKTLSLCLGSMLQCKHTTDRVGSGQIIVSARIAMRLYLMEKHSCAPLTVHLSGPLISAPRIGITPRGIRSLSSRKYSTCPWKILKYRHLQPMMISLFL